MSKRGRVTKNIIISITVQIISLSVSFLIGFIVPKYIEEYQYAYWQTFLLYIGYVGILHFGLLDGIVLRYSQCDYEKLDKQRIRSQYRILCWSVLGIAIIFIVVGFLFFEGVIGNTIVLVAFGVVTKNLIGYHSYLFQITNRIDKYAILIIVQRLSYGMVTVLLLLLKVDNFEWYCIADLFGDFVGIVLALFFDKEICFGTTISFDETIKEWKRNVSAGIILMMSNWLSMLLVGSAKIFIKLYWGELVFGQISFSFNISNLFLVFISAVSVVLFPSLKRLEEEKLADIYKMIRASISPLLFLILIFYFPGCWILEKFLPGYSDSLRYLAIILPSIIYTSKVSLLTNNYLKAYRKEKAMLCINAVSISVAFLMFIVSTCLLKSLAAVLISVVLATILNSVISEVCVMRIINTNYIREFIIEFIITLLFIVIVSNFELWVACITYAVVLLLYFIFERKSIVSMIKKVILLNNQERSFLYNSNIGNSKKKG